MVSNDYFAVRLVHANCLKSWEGVAAVICSDSESESADRDNTELYYNHNIILMHIKYTSYTHPLIIEGNILVKS